MKPVRVMSHQEQMEAAQRLSPQAAGAVEALL